MLKMHVSLESINNMDVGEMVDLMITQQNMLDSIILKEQSDTRKATQEDIDRFFG